MEPVKVFIGVPTGEPVLYADTALAREDPAGDHPVEIVAKANAVWTGSNFNALWALALDMRDAGLVTHFAMLHTDVAPGRGWVGVLAREMQAKGVTVVSACVPIKDATGMTSTAVGSRSDPWAQPRHVTPDDYLSLPATFTTADVARSPDDVLLLNNGCMLIDLRRPWCDDWVFTWQVRIEKGAAGRRHVGFRPEDWEMSRLLDRLGEPYAATSAVVPGHWGHWCFQLPARGERPAAVDVPC